MRNLRRDPSVRFTDAGRNLVRWLDGWEVMMGSVPPHCAYVIADLACAIAEEWLQIAEHLRRPAETRCPPVREPAPVRDPDQDGDPRPASPPRALSHDPGLSPDPGLSTAPGLSPDPGLSDQGGTGPGTAG
jgi:hypothetical protein